MGYLNSAVSSPHALLEIARKRIPGVEPLNIFGVNKDVGTVYETLWNGPSGFALPGSALQMSVVSSSASDTMSILIQGLNPDYQEISDIVTLTGTTPVTTAINFSE